MSTNRHTWGPRRAPARRVRRRGSALLLSMAVTILLFIVGFAFLLNTQTQKLTVSSITTGSTLDEGIDAVVKQINIVLVRDLFGTTDAGLFDTNMLNGQGDSQTGGIGTPGEQDEYYDYPGPDDPWLASLEPEFMELGGKGFHFWRHITDLYNNDFGMPVAVVYYDPDDKNDGTQFDGGPQSQPYRVLSNNITVARIVGEKEVMGQVINSDSGLLFWGGRADADGDGAADSRWVIVPGIKGPAGENIYAAIRITDNGGMINMNTAFRYPDPEVVTAETPKWDGSQLSHIQMAGVTGANELMGVISTGDANANANANANADLDAMTAVLQGYRYGSVSAVPAFTSYNYDVQYERDVAQRLLNPRIVSLGPPQEVYRLFGILDELELRNRYFMTSNVVPWIATLWPITFNPPSYPGRGNPYLPEDTLEENLEILDIWFHAVTSTPTLLRPANANPNHGWTPTNTNIGNYNRRHISTTYNFDRVIIPKPEDWSTAMPLDLQIAWEDWTQWDDAPPAAGGPNPSWSYRPVPINDVVRAVGDSSSDVADVTFGDVDGPIELLAAAIWLGLPDDTELESKDQFDITNGLNWRPDTRERLAYQMAVNLIDYVDKDDEDKFVTRFLSGNGDEYYGYESEAERLYIGALAISYTDGEDHYAIQLYNHGPEGVNLADWKIEVKPIVPPGPGIFYDLPTRTIGRDDSLILIDEDSPTGFSEGEFSEEVDIISTGSFRFTNGDRIVLLGPHSDPVVAGERPVDVVEVFGMPESGPPTGREVTHTDERDVKILDSPPYDEFLAMELEPIWGSVELDVEAFEEPVAISSSDAAKADIQVRSLNDPDSELTTLGEFFNVLAIGPQKFDDVYSATTENWFKLLDDASEDVSDKVEQGRLEVSDEDFANAVRYLTVFSPFNDFENPLASPPTGPIDNDGDGVPNEPQELAIAGRININTAPWFVIAQLPWIQDPALSAEHQYKLAHAIAAYRDKTDLQDILGDAEAPDYSRESEPGENDRRENGMGATDSVREESGFASITELVNVTHQNPDAAAAYYDIRRWGRDGSDLDVAPDYSTDDNTEDDMEERDVLFHRVSNLATVRSDVFTAYILVRLGEGGPQKRVIGIFDRSQVYSPTDKPKLLALHPVPDPN